MVEKQEEFNLEGGCASVSAPNHSVVLQTLVKFAVENIWKVWLCDEVCGYCVVKRVVVVR